MIWTVAVPGRAIAVSAWSHVSTLTPYAAMRCSATSVSRASYTASSEKTSVGGQCSCTRSRTSTPRFLRERSVHCRNASSVYAEGSCGTRRPILVATVIPAPGWARRKSPMSCSLRPSP